MTTSTCQGFLCLAVVIDLCSRRVIGWATRPRQPTDLVLQAFLMAVRRCKPKQTVLIHTDQGPQYGAATA
jgi:putative transposase